MYPESVLKTDSKNLLYNIQGVAKLTYSKSGVLYGKISAISKKENKIYRGGLYKDIWV
jgi:hypothetical protein